MQIHPLAIYYCTKSVKLPLLFQLAIARHYPTVIGSNPIVSRIEYALSSFESIYSDIKDVAINCCRKITISRHTYPFIGAAIILGTV
jgi:hypothetical protein